jgi:hypothetical protein
VLYVDGKALALCIEKVVVISSDERANSETTRRQCSQGGTNAAEEDAWMKELTAEQAIDELIEAAAIQAELAERRVALEWGQKLFTQLVHTWTALESYEPLAYEDKVAVQMRVLDEATNSLWHLHKKLVQANRMLKTHRKYLRGMKNPLIL